MRQKQTCDLELPSPHSGGRGGGINEEYTAVKLRALWVRKMVLLVHDLEMRGRKPHLIHNYEAPKGGAQGAETGCLKEAVQVLRIWKPTNLNQSEARGGASKHNIKYSEDFKRTLTFVRKHSEASLSSLFTWSRYFVAVVIDSVMFVSVRFSLCYEKLWWDDF